ncbi:MBL fold metallo-hydrolase [Dactylosporangium aurantiacum]|uniref:MBL fold metallo-hydrolase n=1 Tax=Dactylosporangium aurantiacum TaxID=35754 RepID=A0A9Q9MJG0_9ACTN|nr:MBL fold metallo-hydrolase [Dactylosporangium aurantiacum]MDG6103787.1 MBL fold metallo-hydrolase [Dactylosporangium aurantiacum]UWZ59004.1 MBL fold metallo-hydrolase [Dactylosporangium aurantiacum]
MEASATFIGNATVLLRLGAFTLLTDPNFLHRGQRAYLGYGMWSRRRTEPALSVEQLPPLDGVILSHLHGDHFDRVARRGLPRDLPFVTTRPAQRSLHRWRFTEAVGLDTWQDVTWRRAGDTVRVTAVPAQHGPAIVHRALPETMGTVVDWERAGQRRLRLYITGDTLFRPEVLREIPERFGDIDVALVHLGGTRILGVLLTMDGRDGVALSRLIRPRGIVPIHYEDYPVQRDPLSRFLRRAEGLPVRTMQRGQTLDLVAAASAV